MRRDLLDILACPVCKGTLALRADKEEAGEVITGTLRCVACGQEYPIENAIPNLLPPRRRRNVVSV
ncbi:MAG: Trm112 family protein [Dehalococcoidia bacterium]|nr:Trm112 family protein [Dehalococcoidia bacterium]